MIHLPRTDSSQEALCGCEIGDQETSKDVGGARSSTCIAIMDLKLMSTKPPEAEATRREDIGLSTYHAQRLRYACQLTYRLHSVKDFESLISRCCRRY